MCGGCVFPGRSEVQLRFGRLDVFGVLQFWCWVRNCSNLLYFEGQKFQEEADDGCGDVGVEAGGECFGEKAPRANFVMAALADFLTDFLMDLHFSLMSFAAC
jgi:hypothetical protein